MAQFKLDFSLLELCKNDILDHHTAGLDSYSISDLILDQSFSIVRLNTGWIGIAMNYGVIYEGREKMRQEAARLKGLLAQDPLLLKTLWDWNQPINSFLRAALQTSVLSALSKPLFEFSESAGFYRKPGGLPLSQVTQPKDSVAVIGLGGYLHSALKDPNVIRVFLADLYMDRPHALKEIDMLRKQYSQKQLLVSDGSQNAEILSQSQVACITASAISNGTLSSLLKPAEICRSVILQGKSGNLFPPSLFQAGVTHITTYDISPTHWGLIQDWCSYHPDGDFSSFLDANFHDQVTYLKK